MGNHIHAVAPIRFGASVPAICLAAAAILLLSFAAASANADPGGGRLLTPDEKHLIEAKDPRKDRGSIPISGRPVPELQDFDSIMLDFMASEYGTEAAVLGLIRNGRVMYLRAFGVLDGSVPMPENGMWRSASLAKPITAAMVRQLAEEGAFGAEGLNRRVFRIGQNNGILPLPANTQVGDQRIADITLQHLIQHSAGFRRSRSTVQGNANWYDGPCVADRCDPMFLSRHIADTLEVPSPPSNAQIIRWALGFQLFHAPQDQPHAALGEFYSNFGYMILGEVINAVTPSGYLMYLRTNVLTPDMGVPMSEMIEGRSLRVQRHPLEPWYRTSDEVESVFSNTEPHPTVSRAYGGFAIENMLAHGGIVHTAESMLHFAGRYHVWYGGDRIGRRVTAALPFISAAHTGGLSGLSTIAQQRADGTSVVIFTNAREVFRINGADLDNVSIATRAVAARLDQGGIQWPAVQSGGSWIAPPVASPARPPIGSYDRPWNGFQHALSNTTSHRRMRLKPGTQNWTGVLDRPMVIDAPEGIATLGSP